MLSQCYQFLVLLGNECSLLGMSAVSLSAVSLSDCVGWFLYFISIPVELIGALMAQPIEW